MLILPERGVVRTSILLPIADREWRTPSQAQPKTAFGHENTTRFYVAARLDDGHIVWKGWFDDRYDFDAFLNAIALGTLHQDRYVQRLPSPWWNPDLQDIPATYIIAATRSLTTTNAANQTDTVPTDWGNITNRIDVVASGGGGAIWNKAGFGAATGGSGAGFSRKTTVVLTPGGSATYRLSAGGANKTSTAVGNAGADAWYNGTTLAGASVGAKGGLGGKMNDNTSTTNAAAVGGAAASGVGSTKFSGGNSGTTTNSFNISASGGGGAALFNGNGNNGANSTSGSASAGGSGDAGSGGTAGTANSGTAAGAGNEYGGGFGAGGGGGGTVLTVTAAGAGGLYGAGGGGFARVSIGGNSGAGAQALIFMTYTPAINSPVWRRQTRFFTRSF